MIKVMTYLDLASEYRDQAAQKKIEALGPRLADRTLSAEQRQVVQDEIQATDEWRRGTLHVVEVSEVLNSSETLP